MKIALTEDISIKNVKTDAGSKILEGYKPPFNATLVDKLQAKGISISNRIRISEFGLEDSFNSADALLKGQIDGVIGSSSLGKGVSKLWPSYGLVSRYGIISPTSTLSPINIMAKEIDKISLLLDIVSAYDEKDSASIDLDLKEEKDFTNFLVPKSLSATVDLIAKEISLEYEKYYLPTYKILASAEFASLAARYDGIRYGYRAKEYEDREELYKNTRSQAFGQKAKETILFGNYVLGPDQYDSYYRQGQKIRTLIIKEMEGLLDESTALLLPLAEDSKESYKLLAFLTGFPMLSIPYKKGIDLHILARPFMEKSLLKLAKDLRGDING